MLTTKEMSQNDFMQFANGHPDRNFWQTDMMADLQSNKGLTTLYLGVYENSSDQPVAAAMTVLEPAHFGLFHARSPRGPLMDFTAPPERIEAVIRAFHDDLSHRKVMYWTIDPYIAYCKRDLEGNPISKPETALHQTMLNIGFEHEGFNVGIDNSREPQWIHIVPTAGMNEASLQKSFLRKAQRNIKDAFTSGVEVWQMEEKDLHLLDELLEDTAKRKGFTWRSSDYHQQLYRSFVDKDGVRFLAASIDLQEYLDRMNKELAEVEADLESVEHNLEQNPSKKMLNKKGELENRQRNLQKRIAHGEEMIQKERKPLLAAGIFFTNGKEVLCLMSGYNEDYKTFNGLYALHWTMMEYCLNNGLDRYNFYGISGDFSDDAIDSGVYDFKKGFNGEVIELPGVYHLPVNKSKYKMYKMMRSIKNKLH